MLILHLTTLFVTAILILIADKDGSDWMRGKKETLSKRRVSFFHNAVFVGLSLMIMTGGYMAYNTFSWYIKDPVFIAKMIFVSALVINGFFIGSLSKIASEMPFKNVDTAKKRKLYLSGAVSTISWISAAICGLLI